jgi:hypothetical protein
LQVLLKTADQLVVIISANRFALFHDTITLLKTFSASINQHYRADSHYQA